MVAIGFTVILTPVAPVDHSTVPSQPLAVSVTLPPSQITSLSAEIDGARQVVTVIVMVPVVEQTPFLQVAV